MASKHERRMMRREIKRTNEDQMAPFFAELEEFIRKHGEPPPRPLGLKGKQIGLWHSKISKIKKSMTLQVPSQKIRPNKSIGDITLTESQKTGIQAVLNNVPDRKPITSTTDISYTNIADSTFKREFLQNINGKLEDHMNFNIDYKEDTLLDEILYHELHKKHFNETFLKMYEGRRKLPSFESKEKIIDLINTNQIILISGETGCGKTTQVPQFILDHFIENKKGSMCKIVCTQPRRISAIAVAERVANERNESIGKSTGYQIRLEKVCPRKRGSITFCTTGVVLRQMQSDPCLSEYTHIIIDEIHERDVQSDFIIALLKKVVTKRDDLKIILMSATLNAESFSKYFGNCPHLNIPGLTFPVKEYFLEDVLKLTKFRYEDGKKSKFNKEHQDFISPYIRKLMKKKKYDLNVYRELENYNSEFIDLKLILKLLKHICYNEEDQGAVLIFLPGLSDISDLKKLIESSGSFHPNKYLIIPLHSLLSTIEQKQIFDVPPPGVRKIIIATGIAETSITIDDVVYVIDCAKMKVMYYNAEMNTEALIERWVTKANSLQRKGRAGRVKPGICYHLMTKWRYEHLDEYMLPEILRTRLENVILNAKILQLGKIEEFFSILMDSPNITIVTKSLELLKQLEALDENESLTPLGYHLAKLPMNPQIGKMILFGALFNCLEPILNIAVALDFKDPYVVPLGQEKYADRKRRELAGNCSSDHLLINTILIKYEKLENYRRKKFCWDYFLSWSTMNQLLKLKNDFMQNLYELKFVPNTNPKCDECNCNSEKFDLIRAVIAAGLYPNIVKIKSTKKRSMLRLPCGQKVSLHPKSILKEQYITQPLLVYHCMVKTSAIFIHDATPVDPFHIIFFGDNFQQSFDGDRHFITINNNNLKFKCQPSTADVIQELRNKLNNLLEYKISHPNVVDLRQENEETLLFRSLIELLNSNPAELCDM